jgi:hypothetical protein
VYPERGGFQSETELESPILDDIQGLTDEPACFTWRAKADDLLEKVTRKRTNPENLRAD